MQKTIKKDKTKWNNNSRLKLWRNQHLLQTNLLYNITHCILTADTKEKYFPSTRWTKSKCFECLGHQESSSVLMVDESLTSESIAEWSIHKEQLLLCIPENECLLFWIIKKARNILKHSWIQLEFSQFFKPSYSSDSGLEPSVCLWKGPQKKKEKNMLGCYNLWVFKTDFCKDI